MLRVDMKMPDNCLDCPMHDPEGSFCRADCSVYQEMYDRPRRCPIQDEEVENKEPIIAYTDAVVNEIAFNKFITLLRKCIDNYEEKSND